MSSYQVSVIGDAGASAAGTAIVRIDGLKAWPADAKLKLSPIDEGAVPPRSEGWPWGEITPLRVVETPDGVDVVLGPDIAGSPRLTPGTPLTISVPAAKIEADARWPSLTPTVRRRQIAVAMSPQQLLAAKAERDQLERAQALKRQQMAEQALKSAREAARSVVNGAVAGSPVLRHEPATVTTLPKPEHRTGSAQTTATHTASGLVREKTAATSDLARLTPIKREEAGRLKPANDASAGQLAKLESAPVGNVVPVTVGLPVPEPRFERRKHTALRGFALGLVTALALGTAALRFMPASWYGSLAGGGAAIAGGADSLAIADLQNLFRDVQAAGPISPQQKAASNVDAATALSLADHNLRGQRSAAETEEAQFWLKRALASSFGSADTGWALTQLGTIYATPGTSQHSYVKARTIWELAVAQGDPVAHCFLGALFEHGLGVARDRGVALEHYRVADKANACRSAKEAVARLSR